MSSSSNNNSNILRIAIARNPPDAFVDCKRFPQFQPTVDCPFPGWTMENFRMVADYLNATVEEHILSYAGR